MQIPHVPEPVQIPLVPETPVQIPEPPVKNSPVPVQIPDVPESVQISVSQVPEPPVQIPHFPEPFVQIPHVPQPVQIPPEPPVQLPEPLHFLHVPEPMQIPDVPQPPVKIPPQLDTLELDPLEPTDALDQLRSFVFDPPDQELQLLHTVPSIFDGDLISFLDEFEREMAPIDLTMPRLDPCVKNSIGFKAI
ncbi:hypothetical protein TNCV_2368381 [Trichonephila clavipes]|nr:hypothetical protein TNCV_2368381 [Trichonephila clavipes]